VPTLQQRHPVSAPLAPLSLVAPNRLVETEADAYAPIKSNRVSSCCLRHRATAPSTPRPIRPVRGCQTSTSSLDEVKR